MPDVSGIDKIFDYLVPDSLSGRLWVGARVRVNLNNRRVGGWVVALSQLNVDDIDERVRDKLQPVVSLSGHGVEPEVVPLTQWMAENFFGSWRQALSSASAPHVREKNVHPQRGANISAVSDEVGVATRGVVENGGGLVVVPPLGSALSVVVEMARRGPVLVVCPTQKMASLGAAFLRRKGLTTATVPEQWDNARAGCDVVIGARSASLAPCASMSSIVVIDEHDELLHEERSPTWNATDVARERARRAGVPCVLSSPVPSASSLFHFEQSMKIARTPKQWPFIEIVNLDDVAVSGSLLSSQLLASAAQESATMACILNTKGKARLIVCRSCRHVQTCPSCASLLTQDDEVFSCRRCQQSHGSVCLACGRTNFLVPRGGMSQLASQLRRSVSKEVIEISGESEESWTQGSLFVGTEAVLHRVSRVDVVVFADIDRDLGAPRLTAAREVLSLVVRAARVVGEHGKVIIQTRRPDHPVLVALASETPMESILDWCRHDLAQRKSFSLPPYGRLVEVSVRTPHSLHEFPELTNISLARYDEYVLLNASHDDDLRNAVAKLREVFGTSLSVHVDPVRY